MQLYISGTFACNPHICLRWTVTWKSFTLVCHVKNIKYPVFIDNQKGEVAARYFPPYPSTNCKSRAPNTSTVHNNHKSDIMFLFHGEIDKHINGNWTCRHGTGLDIAFIEVTILGKQGGYLNLFDNFIF